MEKMMAKDIMCVIHKGGSADKLIDEINQWLISNPKYVILNIDYQVVRASASNMVNEYSALVTCISG